MSALEQSEIDRMTHPLKQPAAQARFLRSIGIRVERRPDGSCLVLREWLAQQATESAKSRPKLRSERREQAAQTR